MCNFILVSCGPCKCDSSIEMLNPDIFNCAASFHRRLTGFFGNSNSSVSHLRLLPCHFVRLSRYHRITRRCPRCRAGCCACGRRQQWCCDVRPGLPDQHQPRPRHCWYRVHCCRAVGKLRRRRLSSRASCLPVHPCSYGYRFCAVCHRLHFPWTAGHPATATNTTATTGA